MRSVLIVNDSDEAKTILKFLLNKVWIKQTLKKVKIDTKAKETYLLINKKKKIKGIANILAHLQTNHGSAVPPKRQERPQIVDYGERVLKGIYGDGSRISIPDDDDITEDMKAKKKQQAEEQYRRHMERVNNPIVPKKIQIEDEPYVETMEEKKEGELYDYYQSIIGSSGD